MAVELSATEGESETGVEETLAPTWCELELGKEDNEKAADESLTPVRRKRW